MTWLVLLVVDMAHSPAGFPGPIGEDPVVNVGRTTERGDTSVGERAAHDLWPQYRGLASDEVQIEIYERWLEPIEEAKQ